MEAKITQMTDIYNKRERSNYENVPDGGVDTDARMSGNTTLLLIKAKQTNGTWWVTSQNLIVFDEKSFVNNRTLCTVYTSGINVPTTKKKEKKNSLSRAFVQTLERERERDVGGF